MRGLRGRLYGRGVQVYTVVSGVFGARCSVIADAGACVVVDPGALVTASVVSVVEERGLAPCGVLLTHGHVDHTWDAADVADALGVPVWVHAADAYRLADPFGTLGPLGGAAHDPSGPLAQALAAAGADPRAYRAPSDIRTFGTAELVVGRDDDVVLPLGALAVRARHAPGHTEGSTIYLVDGPPALAFTGDVLFAGTIGRTDLPGGDDARMRATLREVVARLDPELVVLPGHGPTSTVADELARNPFLR